MFAYAEAENVTLRIDGTQTQVRRPKAGRPGRAAFVSGKRKQNTIKTTTISDGQGRTLWCGAVRPGRTHYRTAMRTEGIAEQLRLCPRVKAEVETPGPNCGGRSYAPLRTARPPVTGLLLEVWLPSRPGVV
ncbi:transposase family protein [Streptomyces sp. NBC_01210]|uniref:transposase family protein n=1 Tax=Streptomyces sp. NBC_01210 TaxID=2903774 RepID=UPI002E1233E2|nr:transposase family protein [Streptomyces sp. NBC_01210]